MNALLKFSNAKCPVDLPKPALACAFVLTLLTSPADSAGSGWVPMGELLHAQSSPVVRTQGIEEAEFSENEMMKWGQQNLKALGYYSGKIDGVMGPQTAAAFQKLLRASGLRGGATPENIGKLYYASMIMVGKGYPLPHALQLAPDASAWVDTLDAFEKNLTNLGVQVDDDATSKALTSEAYNFFGPKSPFTLTIEYHRATVLATLGKSLEARALLDASHNRMKASLGPNHYMTQRAENVLANLDLESGRYADAEERYRSILERQIEQYGLRHRSTLVSIHNLALTLLNRGRFTEAEILYRRAVTTWENHSDMSAPLAIAALSGHADSLTALGRHDEAEAVARKAQSKAKQHLPQGHEYAFVGTSSLARALATQKKYEEAVKVLQEFTKTNHMNSSPYWYAEVELNALQAITFNGLGQADEAYKFATAAVQQLSSRESSETLDFLRAQIVLADTLQNLGRFEEAEQAYETALNGVGEIFLNSSEPLDIRKLDQTGELSRYFPLISSMYGFEAEGARRSFIAQNWYSYGRLDKALADLALRRTMTESNAGDLLQSWQSAREELLATRSAYDKSLGETESSSKRTLLGSRLSELRAKVERLQARVEREHPQIAQLIKPQAMTIGETQKMLRPDEGMVAFLSADTHLYAWFVTQDHAEWREVDMPLDDLLDAVDRLRRSVDLSLDPAAYKPMGDCAVSSDVSFLSNRAFDACVAEYLYKQLFGKFDLDQVKHLVIVPDGPLEKIPFSLLVRDREGDEIDWMIKQHAISIQPTTAGLRAIRGNNTRDHVAGARPFLGIAPETFTGHSKGSPLRAVPDSLPATVEEVRQLSYALGADSTGIVTGPSANESFVKNTNLSSYSIISFATHGLTATEANTWTAGKIAEPALVLSGPDGKEDGILTASEAAALRISADWVLLSGCNTAAGEKANAEGMSGLARAFFFAGADALLVSHWSVEDSSAKLLMTSAIEEAAQTPSLGKAGALRQAILKVMATENFDHPFFWAPFELVGEGLSEELKTAEYVLSSPGSSVGYRLAMREPKTEKPPLRGILRAESTPFFIVGSEGTEAALSLDRTARREVQTRINLAGFDLGRADGSFGPKTRKAIAAWQQSEGFPESGFLEKEQLAFLRDQTESQYEEWKAKAAARAAARPRKVKKCTNLGIVKLCRYR